MSKSFLRGLSFGIILVTAIFTFLYNPLEEKSEIIVQQEQELNDTVVSDYIKNKGQTLITIEKLNHFKQKEAELIQLETEIKKLEESIAHLKNEKKAKTTKEDASPTKYYVLEVVKGMNSPDVSDQLEKATIIESASKFEEYLQTKNWGSSIQIGIYELNSKMTIEEIAKIITKKG